MNNDFLERNQLPHDPRRTAFIELFVKKAGDRLAGLIDLANELQEHGDCSFEQAIEEALDIYKIE